jgi:hypothetical protein
MKEIFVLFCVVFIALFGLFLDDARAQITIDNDLAGDGRWEVDVDDAGDSRDARIDPVGPTGLTDVVFDYFTYVDSGADGGGIRLHDTNVTTPAFSSGADEVTSSGNFPGPNGTINWTAISSIADGSSIYNVNLSFTSSVAFGTVRIISYLDEDVLGSSDDVLVVLGTPGDDNFLLLTIDDDQDVGVAQAAGYNTATGMTYIGWAADEFSDLRSAITGSGATYSIPGVIDMGSLPPIVDPRFPSDPAYGPEDITSAFAFDLNPSATSATVNLSLGGSPSGQPPGGEPVEAVVPTMTEWGMMIFMVLAGLGSIYYIRRKSLEG